jgi:predicted nucleotidyltransferase
MLEELRKCLKIEKHNTNIFDIVLYGSAVKGKEKPNDIDIAVIFRQGLLGNRLDTVQRIKRSIKMNINLDMKPILLEDLFKPEFFARSGIFHEGVSLFDGKKFANKIDFEGAALFVYDLKGKSHNEKVKFNYILSGRNSNGLIKLLGGKHVSPGVVEIPVGKSLEFREFLEKQNITFEENIILKKLK